MVFYETFATFEALTPAECAAKFLSVTNDANTAALLQVIYMVRTFAGAIPYVGGIVVGLASILLAPGKTVNYLEWNLGMLDAYFLCAMGEEGFTQELYENDFSPKMNFMANLQQESEQFKGIPFYGIYVMVVNIFEIQAVLETMSGSPAEETAATEEAAV